MSPDGKRNCTACVQGRGAYVHGVTIQTFRTRQMLLELGHALESLAVKAQHHVVGPQADWELFADAIISGRRNVGVCTASRLAKEIAASINENCDSEALWRYCAAKIFRTTEATTSDLGMRWHLICQSSELQELYQYVTLQVFQEPLVAIRNKRGIEVFLNICPHRQTQLLTGSGRLRQAGIRCQYHLWAFSCEGNCLNIPGSSRLEFGSELPISEYHLQQLPSAEVDGYIYVWLGEGKSPSLPSSPVSKSMARRPAALRIARLLDSVHPSFPDVRNPELPDDVRFLIRLGWLKAALERKAAAILPSHRMPIWQLLERMRELHPAESNAISLYLLELRQGFFDCGSLPEGWAEFREKLLLLRPEAPARSTRPISEAACDEAGLKSLPIWTYCSREMFLLEVEHLIKPTWQFICHEKEIPSVGDVTYLDIVGERVYVGRRADGSLFAGRMLTRFVEEPGISSLERCLEPVDLEVWNGLIFIRLSGKGQPVRETWEYPRLLEPYRLWEMEPIESGSYDFDVEANYKILWENFLELYHFQAVHKGTCRLFHVRPESDLLALRQSLSPYCTKEELSYATYLRTSPPHSEENEIAFRELADTKKYISAPLRFTFFGSIAKQDQSPITMGLTVFPDHIQAMSFIPLGPDNCRIRIRSYGHKLDLGTDYGRAMAAARDINVRSLQVKLIEEDIRLNYFTARAATSKVYRGVGVLGRMEESIRQFQKQVYRAIKDNASAAQRRPGTLNHLRPTNHEQAVPRQNCRISSPEPARMCERRIKMFSGQLRELATPAFVIDNDQLLEQATGIKRLAQEAGCTFLYAMKALSFGAVIRTVAQQADGLSASSIFEASLGREILGPQKEIHAVSPGFRSEEIGMITEICNVLVLNSLSQWHRFRNLANACSFGLRINPGLSIVKDRRYDPCRKDSKLGVPIDLLADALEGRSAEFDNLEGFHIHTACDLDDFDYLFNTVSRIECRLLMGRHRLRWINLGGGYLFDGAKRVHCLFETIHRLRSHYGLTVYIEPGAAVVRQAGFLVASVVDLFTCGQGEVAVLDTSINHAPETFEYQFAPPVSSASTMGQYEYLLAGATCLAGDLFGTYRFDERLEIGSKIVFTDMGAYTLVKANMFNGFKLPAIYTFSSSTGFELRKDCKYEDFLLANGETPHATL
ncbi:MAG: Rieske 2Fe-2S domain-containing protein [Acidobacteriia bacterium]|nr:Rieske 2Fe-2S domain-containing protein [Terriglobia bacterium]